jgi:hypothetical protein
MSGQLHAPAALPLAGWAPEPVWTTCRREKSYLYRNSNSDPSAVQPVSCRYTDWSIPAPKTYVVGMFSIRTELFFVLFRSEFVLIIGRYSDSVQRRARQVSSSSTWQRNLEPCRNASTDTLQWILISGDLATFKYNWRPIDLWIERVGTQLPGRSHCRGFAPNMRRSVSKTSTITHAGPDANICPYCEPEACLSVRRQRTAK